MTPTTWVLGDNKYRYYRVAIDEHVVYCGHEQLGVYETQAAALAAALRHSRVEHPDE